MVGADDAHRDDDIELTGATVADQDFIAHARQDLPRLLAEVRRLRAQRSSAGPCGDVGDAGERPARAPIAPRLSRRAEVVVPGPRAAQRSAERAAGAPVLVTGAAGFIGSHVVDELLARGHEVVALDDLSGGFRDHVDPRARFVEGSILDVALVDRLFDAHRFAYVFHLAAYAAEGLSHFIKRFNYQHNLIGSVNLINASVRHDVRAFVFASSIAVYGRTAPPVTEAMPTAPDDPYGVAKAAVEQDLRISREVFGLRSIIFRPHNVYGERQHLGDRYRNVVGIFISQILRGEPLTIFGDGTQTRAFSHVADVAPVIAGAIDVPAAYDQTFNLGADRAVTVNELGEIVSRAMGVPFRPRYLPARHEVAHVHASHAQARALLGYEERVSLEAGVTAMAAWARRHGPRPSPRVGAIEVEKNLPPSWRARTEKPERP
ncbi:MAG: NAD-dependent epimerase/dehydratase family protein [Myxococcales bacterium]|nr:NAD-dependent epimerase/dehydratase family protein [Myxococcales bacterium]